MSVEKTYCNPELVRGKVLQTVNCWFLKYCQTENNDKC